jgi:Bax protein
MIVGGADRVLDAFTRAGYTLSAVEAASRAGDAAVPRFLLSSLPRDLHAIDSIEDRKALFIKAMLPLILAVNEEILRERAVIQSANRVIGAGGSLTLADAHAVERIMAKYGSTDMNELERRVDVIPPSLALAQAAEESGWGTSRFAKQANALFGHTGEFGGCRAKHGRHLRASQLQPPARRGASLLRQSQYAFRVQGFPRHAGPAAQRGQAV